MQPKGWTAYYWKGKEMAHISHLPYLGVDYMRRAGLVSRAGSVCRDLGHLLSMLKITAAITWKNLSPANWDPGIAMPGSRLDRLKIYHVITIAGPTLFYPAVRTGSSNTHFFSLFIIFLFFLGHLPQTPGFRPARQILAVSFATRARTCILRDLNKFYTRRGGRTTAGSNALGAFLVVTKFRFRTKWITRRSIFLFPYNT